MNEGVLRQNLERFRAPLLYISIWSLSVFCFTLPGRPSSGMDAVTLFKLLVCGCVGVWTFADLLCTAEWRLTRISWLLGPLMLFVAWSVLTVLWSPIKIVSIGQLCSWTSLLLLSATVANCSRIAGASSRIFDHLFLAVLCVNTVLLVVHLIHPEVGGLHRTNSMTGADGIIHPTAAGANASIGLLFAACGILIWPSRLRVWFSLPAVVVHGAILVLAQNRTAAALIVCMFPVLIFVGFRRQHLGKLAIVSVVCSLAVLIFDPGLTAFESTASAATELAYRGETHEQLMTLNGRTLLWEVILDEFAESPWLGHGYFSTSERGSFFMWGRTRNHTAHNALLQLLVSTGLVGSVIFVWGILRVVWYGLVRSRVKNYSGTQITVGLLMLWYFGWSQLCESFMGPVRTESLVFFVGLGLLLASDLQHHEPVGGER